MKRKHVIIISLIIAVLTAYGVYRHTKEISLSNNTIRTKKEYYENGNIKAEIPFQNNVIHGIVIQYYDNGDLKSEETYKNGQKNGFSAYFYPNGLLQQEIFYKNNKPNGKEYQFDRNGYLIKEVIHSE